MNKKTSWKSISSPGTNERVMAEVVAFARSFNEPRAIRILELGAGSGTLSKNLRDMLNAEGVNYSIECGDIEPDQINSQQLDFSCIYVNAQEPFNVQGKYDVVITVELIEHIENPFHLIREIAQITEPGALFVVTSPNTLSLRSRFRFLLNGCQDYFRRPYNEYWLNMGHVNPINPIQLVYILRKNGFAVDRLQTNQYTLGSLLLSPLIPFILLNSFVHYVLREKSPSQRKRNRKLLSLLSSFDMFFGKIAIYSAKRERSIIAKNDTWFRSDDNFES